MPKRLLDCCASDFRGFSKADLLESIQKSEGRVIACETIGTVQPLLGNVTNAEFAASMGADILLLNMFDVQHPVINGLPETEPENTVRMLKKLTGRPIGINLEPVAEGEEGETDPIWKMSAGRRATVENALRAKELGVDFILLTGNPGMGVSNPAIIETLRKFKAAVGDSIVLAAGKMHAAGVLTEAAESILTEADIADFTAAGADIILLPELPYDIKKVAAAVENRAKAGKNFSILAVAEGAFSTEEAKMKRKEWTAKRAEAGYTTATARIAKQIEEMTGAETRICVPGHMQRGGSPSAYDRVLATQFGSYAAGLVADEHYGVTVAMVNRHVTANPLADIAGKTRGVPGDCDMLNVARAMGISLG